MICVDVKPLPCSYLSPLGHVSSTVRFVQIVPHMGMHETGSIDIVLACYISQLGNFQSHIIYEENQDLLDEKQFQGTLFKTSRNNQVSCQVSLVYILMRGFANIMNLKCQDNQSLSSSLP